MAQGDEINHLEVFERDNWICHICKEPVDPKLRKPNKMAATIDHIIPISLGGGHFWDNVATAHAICNFSKSNVTLSA